MLQAALDDARLLPEPLACGTELVVQLGELSATEISCLDPLNMAPDPILGIQLGCVGGKALHVNVSGSLLAQHLLDQLAPVHCCPIPDDEQLARNMPQQLHEEGTHFTATDRMCMDLKLELAPLRDSTNYRKVIVAQLGAKKRRLSHWCVRAHDR